MAGQLYRYVKNGQYYSRYFNLSVNRGKRKHPSLYKPYPIFPPIFRYSLLFPANIPFKFKGHSELYKTKQYTKDKCSFENVSMYFNKNYNNSTIEGLYSNFIKEYFNTYIPFKKLIIQSNCIRANTSAVSMDSNWLVS